MAQVNFWKVLGVIGTLSEEISKSLADDGKISAAEILSIGSSVTKKLDLPIDEASAVKLDLVIAIVEELSLIVADKRITVSELVNLGEKVCEKLGIDLDKEGFSF